MQKTQKEINYEAAFTKLKEGLIEAEWQKNDRGAEPDPATRYVKAYATLKAYVKCCIENVPEDLYRQLKESEIC